MSNLYKSRKKCYLIDHHSPNTPVVPLNLLDIQEYRSFIEEADIDSMMVYCKDHWGVTYYDSHVPGAQKHHGLSTDWIAQASQLLREKDIEFIAYYCIEYDEGAARLHPQWRARNSDGTPMIRDDTFAKWSLCCYQTGYRDYCKAQLREIVTNYHPDALFLDIFGATLCYCDHCRSKFKKRFGYPIPETAEMLEKHTADITAFLDGNAKEFYLEIKQLLKELDPTLAITVNFSCHYPQDFRELLDYQFSEPILKDNWFSSAYARDTAQGQYPILAPGEASQVYNYLHKNQYIHDLSCIAAQGCRVGMYSGSQHPDGTLDHEEARRLGAAYQVLDQMAPYLTSRTPYGNIAILQSDASKAIKLPGLEPDAILRMKRHCPHTDAVLGAMTLCENAKIPWRVLPDRTLTPEILKEYSLLLLPEVYVITDELAELLKEYVKTGGQILASMETGLWNGDGTRRESSVLSGLFGVDFVQMHQEYRKNGWSAYLSPREPDIFRGLLSCTTPPVSEEFAEVRSVHAKTLAEFLLPCTACDFEHWVNWWSPPPGQPSGFPAVTLHTYGSGKVLYTAFDYFTMAQEDTYQDTDHLFSDLLNYIGFVPKLRNVLSHPHMIKTAFFQNESGYLIHQISSLPRHFKGETIPVSGGTLVLQGKIRQARLVYPKQSELAFRDDGHSTTIFLPEFSMQQIIQLDI